MLLWGCGRECREDFGGPAAWTPFCFLNREPASLSVKVGRQLKAHLSNNVLFSFNPHML